MEENKVIDILGAKPQAKRNLAMISIDDVVDGQRELMRKFIQKISHVQPMMQKAMIKAYSDALDEMAILLDRSRAE